MNAGSLSGRDKINSLSNIKFARGYTFGQLWISKQVTQPKIFKIIRNKNYTYIHIPIY